MQQLKQYREQNPGKTYLDFKKYAEGGEIPPSNKPIIPEEPQPYKGKLYKDRYGRKYTEDQMNEYYDSSTDEIDRFTGKPFIRGLKPVGDIEDAANATPVGDAISAYDTYKALKNKDWEGAGLAAMGLIPFIPSLGGVAVKSSKKISKPKSAYIPTEQLNKPLFNPNRHPKFSPDLSVEEVELLKDSVYFNREDLLEILNILILNYINLEDILDDQLDRHGTDNARISDSEV